MRLATGMKFKIGGYPDTYVIDITERTRVHVVTEHDSKTGMWFSLVDLLEGFDCGRLDMLDDGPVTQRTRGAKCTACGVSNEYQDRPFVCGTCRAWGKA